MAPPQVNLNEKPPASDYGFEAAAASHTATSFVSDLSSRYNDLTKDPLPEKKASQWEDLSVALEGQRIADLHQTAAVIKRRQQKRCRLACCVSLSFIIILMMALGTACLVYRLKHRRGWRAYCGVKGDHVPEHVEVDHDKRLITVRPEYEAQNVMEVMHEYNRRLIAFKNNTEGICYIDRLDETFEDGYARWQAYEEKEHQPERHLRVVPTPIDVEVVKHIAGINIYAHCGAESVEYHWVVMAVEIEVTQHPENKYIKV